MTNNGAYPYPGLPGGQLPPTSSGISFTDGELSNIGKQITGQVSILQGLKDGVGGLGVPFPSFGVIGIGIELALDRAVNAQGEALAKAHKALSSWQPALEAADRNYRKANDESGDPFGPGGPGGPGDLGDFGGPGGLENVGLGGAGAGDLPGMPDGSLPGSDLPGSDLPGSDLPGSDLPGSDLPGSDLPGVDTPSTDLPSTELPQQNMPGLDPADMKVPDIASALNDPSKTDLSSYQPMNPNLAGNPASMDPSGLGTRTGPGTMGGPGAGTGMGGPANGLSPAAAAGLRGAGAGGMPMMPFMPPMGGAAGGQEERDREQTVGLSEDEGVWGGDEDVAPQVIGQEEL
ncbi:hypothetical protein [Nonomuraea jiangxiensis]|uniref:Excreted virulence factor EspC, type VII ESX diderm n=1 Tax=Nonomuraea jiangxiensis TaxID=633440 RepID=A0A1G8FIP2_9ACTN|nr:hypothetical protein [Nonomuraea jiangxiensis]SDH81972.1 hypothetical protein SAMN05421869_103330 [Nonomuraea jiangxiensis]